MMGLGSDRLKKKLSGDDRLGGSSNHYPNEIAVGDKTLAISDARPN